MSSWPETVSTVWQTQHRLFVELLQKLAKQLSEDEPRAPAMLEEQLVRLLAVAMTLLCQHQVNKRGQCQFCNWTIRQWRWWRRRRRCIVHQAVDLALSQGLDVVWWLVFENIGQQLNLTEARAWLEARAADTDAIAPLETVQDDGENAGRHAATGQLDVPGAVPTTTQLGG